MRSEKSVDANHTKRILYVATTELTTDGLTAVFINVSQIAAKDYFVQFALAEGGQEKLISRLKTLGPVVILPSRGKRLPQYMLALYRLIKQEHFDIVHIHGNSATMAVDLLPAKLGGVPKRIAHCHNCAKQPWIKQKTLGIVCNKLVTSPVACSIASGKMLYSKPFTVLTNGIDCKRFAFSITTRNRVREELGLQNAFVIGHIGRFTEQKNHLQLMDVFAAIFGKKDNAYLILCGEGKTMAACKEKAKALNIQKHVFFLGNVVEPEEYLCAMDVFILPSLFEGLPLAGIEAQANGLPCVFSDKITKEIAVLSEVSFLPLEASNQIWADTILQMPHSDRDRAAEKVAFAGYDQNILEEQVKRLYGKTKSVPGVGCNYNI